MSTDDQARKIEKLIERIELLPDSQSRQLFQDCLHEVLALHGAGLERILQLVAVDARLREKLIEDKLVSGLLLIHGLHPTDLETRLHGALNTVLPYIQSHGGNLELVSLVDGVARVRFQGTCKTCPSSAVTFELAIKRAIAEACPDLLGLEVEGADAAAIPVGAR